MHEHISACLHCTFWSCVRTFVYFCWQADGQGDTQARSFTENTGQPRSL